MSLHNFKFRSRPSAQRPICFVYTFTISVAPFFLSSANQGWRPRDVSTRTIFLGTLVGDGGGGGNSKGRDSIESFGRIVDVGGVDSTTSFKLAGDEENDP